jgi:hypothetical protein
MMDCDDVRTALLLGGAPDAAVTSHLAACPRCAGERVVVGRLAAALAADTVPAPPSSLAAELRRAAAPLLERNARRAAWPALGRALAAGLLPLPAILFVDFHALRAAYAMLSSILPGALSLYVVFNYAATLTLLLALSYSAIPILAERQVRGRRRESHG